VGSVKIGKYEILSPPPPLLGCWVGLEPKRNVRGDSLATEAPRHEDIINGHPHSLLEMVPGHLKNDEEVGSQVLKLDGGCEPIRGGRGLFPHFHHAGLLAERAGGDPERKSAVGPPLLSVDGWFEIPE